jgi:pSer/pThr/pTyr-binding forkhead associated (FHA) protein
MIKCPNCSNQEFPGAYFCSECGTQLIPLTFLHTHVINKSNIESTPVQTNASELLTRRTSIKKKDPSISLHLVESGQVIHLSDKKDFTIGRALDGQSIIPDIDLTPYDAFSNGVSRMHCSLRIMNGEVYAMDLGSSNGTRVNGQKIVPHVDYSINHGDILVLGKMKIQVLLIK